MHRKYLTVQSSLVQQVKLKQEVSASCSCVESDWKGSKQPWWCGQAVHRVYFRMKNVVWYVLKVFTSRPVFFGKETCLWDEVGGECACPPMKVQRLCFMASDLPGRETIPQTSNSQSNLWETVCIHQFLQTWYKLKFWANCMAKQLKQ